MSQLLSDVATKLQEIQALTENLDEREASMVEELCASILVVFSSSN